MAPRNLPEKREADWPGKHAAICLRWICPCRVADSPKTTRFIGGAEGQRAGRDATLDVIFVADGSSAHEPDPRHCPSSSMSLATKSLTHRFSRVMKLNAVAIAWTAACIGVLIASLVAVTRAPSAGTPPPLDYLDDASWAALPQLNDGADILPAWCGADAQPDAPADAFFVTPSSPLSYPSDNAPTDHMLTRLIDWSVIVMMATAFNGAANVYAPRYRTASSAVQGANVHSEFFNWRPIGEEPVSRHRFDPWSPCLKGCPFLPSCC